MAHQLHNEEIKAHQEHIEHGDHDAKEDITKEVDIGPRLTKSRFDELGLWRTLWVFRRAALCCLSVYTGFLCEGFELSAGGAIVANQGFVAQFGTVPKAGSIVLGLDPNWVAAWGAVLNVGQILAFSHIWYINDRYGRKVALLEAWVWLVAGLLFLNFAKTPAVWMLGKLCNGAGVGIIQVTAQVYVMEICPNRIRGGMEAFSAVWQGIGGIIQSVMMYQINKNFPTDYILALRVIWAPVGLIFFCFFFIPESPWFHVKRGNSEAAMKSLRQLYGNVEGYDFEEELAIIQNTLVHENNTVENAPSFKQVFRGNNLKRTMVIFMMAAAGQLLGTGAISTYNTYFFSIAGFKDPFQAGMILSCTNLTAVIFWTFTTDKFGRRRLVCVCQSVAVVTLFVVGGLYYTGATSGNVQGGIAILVLAAMWGWFYSIVVKSYYLFSAELPSAVLRVKTVPITFCANSILGLATSFSIPKMLVAMNIRATWVFGGLSLPIAICMWFFLPETKGRSAAEIDELYERKIPAWRWESTVTESEEVMRAAVARKGLPSAEVRGV